MFDFFIIFFFFGGFIFRRFVPLDCTCFFFSTHLNPIQQKKKPKSYVMYILFTIWIFVLNIYIYIYIIFLFILKLMFYHLCIIYYIKKLKCNYFTNEIIIDYIGSLYFMFATNIYNNQSDTPLTFMVGSIKNVRGESTIFPYSKST